MQLRNDDMTLSFGTAGPGPDGLRITVRPRDPRNEVLVHFRVDGGATSTICAHPSPDAAGSDDQVFLARFPELAPEALVEYLPVCKRGKRQVPPPDVRDLPASFRVPERDAARQTDPVAPPTAGLTNHPLKLVHLARFSVFVREPEIIGATPDGLKVNWWVKSGSFAGPRIRGVLRPEGADWMTIRPDGIGILEVRSTLETHDRALVSASYTGVFELGENGYQNFLCGKYPHLPEARTVPRYLTADPRYKWLNRLQCVAAGNVNMNTLNFVYDSYAFM